MVREVWRADYAARGDGSGYRRAEKKLAAFFTVCAFLADEFPGQRFANPPRRWRESLRSYWRKQGHDITPERPHHSVEEAVAIWANRHLADPRVALAVTLGAGLRGGQVVKTMRSHCQRVEHSWVIQVPFRDPRKKPKLYLNANERTAFETALATGYLSELEATSNSGSATIRSFRRERFARTKRLFARRSSRWWSKRSSRAFTNSRSSPA
ncbi:MAG TPA: hypothetical protein VFS20_13800 [Longimicrobium sp.]|nr:hypothetical protein [Longimicrobium sp.]